MSNDEISRSLEDAGFTEDQISGLMQSFALHPHTHSIEDVIGLDSELQNIEDELSHAGDEDDEE